MKKLKLAVMLLILTATSNVFADHHIKIEPEDKILLSSNTIYILNNSKQYALYHSCDLNVNSNSEVIVKNKGRTISKSSPNITLPHLLVVLQYADTQVDFLES